MSETNGNTALGATMAGHLEAGHIWIVACPNGSAESYVNPSVSDLTTCTVALCAKSDPGHFACWQLSSLWQTTSAPAHSYKQNAEWEATDLISINAQNTRCAQGGHNERYILII